MSTKVYALRRDMKEKREQINMMLDWFLPRKDDYPKEIHKAMRHTLFAGGKRTRPYLTILTYLLFKSPLNNEVVKAASAIELLHTYTLIHDDLPEIDNDDFRRGKKTCHVVFGADIALLAGDALLIEAFNLVNVLEISPEIKIKMLYDMAVLCGERGLIAGQMQDILSEGKPVSKKTLEFIHLNKTAKLLQLCTRFGAYLAEAPVEELKRVDEFGAKLGLAFQIRDDILDVEGDSNQLGKTVGKDADEKKATYPAVMGMEKSKLQAEKYTKAALRTLDKYGEKAFFLCVLTNELLLRNN
jgi:geranylgeranyl diphosphate synthase type II